LTHYLLNTFSIVLLTNSTLKTNRYKLPLLNIINMISTLMTFFMAFAF